MGEGRPVALVDGKRVFDPRLEGVPVLVLSNNNGCAIARSQEVKALGVKMGAPAFQLRPLQRQPSRTAVGFEVSAACDHFLHVSSTYSGEADTSVKSSHFMYAGLDAWTPVEGEVTDGLNLRRAGAESLADTSSTRRSSVPSCSTSRTRRRTPGPVSRAGGWRRTRSSGFCDVVGLAITEYTPWEAIATRDMLRKLPLLSR